MELKFKHLAPYLPYGLKLFNTKSALGGQKIDTNILTVIGIQDDPIYIKLNEVMYWHPLDFFKPILRPLSDLTKEIEVNDEKFIPLLKLREIEGGYWDEGEFYPDIAQIIDYGIRQAEFENPCYWVEWKDELSQTQSFSFKGCDFNRCWITNKGRLGGLYGKVINNQLQLFRKLFEWHFDLYDLIENNLAIDINSIKDK